MKSVKVTTDIFDGTLSLLDQEITEIVVTEAGLIFKAGKNNVAFIMDPSKDGIYNFEVQN